MSDSFIGHSINGYIIQEKIGKGCIGAVYKAVKEELDDVRAVKFVPMDVVSKKNNWEQEIIKVNKLRRTEGVVHYHTHDTIEVDGVEYLYIMWDYIPGKSLKNYISSNSLTMQMVVDVVIRSLSVFHACKQLGIQHADFHSGNILIEEPDPLNINGNIQKVWITDFGYGTFSQVNATPPMDDYDGLCRIIQQCVESVDVHKLDYDARNQFRVLKNEFPKYLHESDPMAGTYARNPSELLKELRRLLETKDDKDNYPKRISDFLAAELIGDKYDEWEALFVPKFLATESLLDKNTCVLTGLRGCGKTMIFKRLSFELMAKLGPANIQGEESFVGFYINARNLVEAFPWLPENKFRDARRQVINFFNVKWCVEILEWLRECANKDRNLDFTWLSDFFSQCFPNNEFVGDASYGIIYNIIEACIKEMQRSKLGDRYERDGDWPFAEYDFLGRFLHQIQQHHRFCDGKSFYLFLDDYSSPMINPTMQRILNPVIFRREQDVFFKVSTESTESFVAVGLNEKVLENGPDYKLIDLGSELFKSNRDKSRVKDIIVSIFDKRITRSNMFSGRTISLEQILGRSAENNTTRAEKIRSNAEQTVYYGIDVFCDLWSSDIRELIKVFSEMISAQGEDNISKCLAGGDIQIPLISPQNQDYILRETGGRLLYMLADTTNPSRINHTRKDNETYGEHLRQIVSAFQKIAYNDLKTKNSKNQERTPPKQARKIELTSSGKLCEEAEGYYKGLIRYGVFIQDYRAKSVRGTAAQRLYLRSMLIPYCRLTFSRRDCITMDWTDFERFLLHPEDFADEYIRRSQSANKYGQDEGQTEIQGIN